METIFGHVEIKGVGPRYCAVAVFDADENLIGETQSDRHGNWRLSPVALPAGKHTVHAVMRNSTGGEFTSDDINLSVGDPANEVIVEAETLDPELVAAMAELDAEEREAEHRRQAAVEYLNCVDQQARGYEAGTELNGILTALGRSRDEFCADVATERLKFRYSQIVCKAAAGIELDDDEKRYVWQSAGVGTERFQFDVGCTQRASLAHLKEETGIV